MKAIRPGMWLRCGVRSAVLALWILTMVLTGPSPAPAGAATLIIAASPSVKAPLEAIAAAYERLHPDITVRITYDTGLGLRQMIASAQNTGRYFIESGPVHLVAPASQEVIRRLETRSYVLPGTTRLYASVPLVLVVPEALADAPETFEALAADPRTRLAVADPGVSELGLRTRTFLEHAGLASAFKERLHVAQDARSVIDHVLNGEADAGIVFASDVVRSAGRVRPTAASTPELSTPIVYGIAMERFCPDRALCQDFLAFTETAEAAGAIGSLGYSSPRQPSPRTPMK